MPVVTDQYGQFAYVSEKLFFSERPADFLKDSIYSNRLIEARRRILEVIRFHGKPLLGRGYNHEISGIGTSLEQLTEFVDKLDGKKSRRVRKQADKSVRRFGGFTINSPQDMKRRRRSLFSLDDVSPLFFSKLSLATRDYEPFIDLMRWHLLRDALEIMIKTHEIELVNESWYVKVSVLDVHRGCGTNKKRKPSVKHDDRSYHGRPNRDRYRAAA